MKGKLPLLFTLFILLSAHAFADTLADTLADFQYALDAKVTVPNDTLVASPQTVTVTVVANNPYETAMPLYVLRQVQSGSAKGWEVVKLIGALAPDSKSTVQLDVELTYPKQAIKTTRYAIVGRAGDGQLYGTYFEIREDWGAYESSVNGQLAGALSGYAPVVAVVLIILFFVVVRHAYRARSPGIVRGEYTMKTLVFPEVEGRPFGEKVADIMINPIMMAFEVACVAVLVFVMFESATVASGFDTGLKILALSAVGAVSIPFIYLAAAWYFEKREEGKPLRFFAGMFVWGMFAAFLSLMVSSSIVTGLQGAQVASYALFATMLVAPIVEETLKGLGVLFIAGHHEYNDTLTGLLLGFSCGVGFAFIENWFYFSSKVNPFDIGFLAWGQLILYRSFFNTLAHGCFTATASTAIGYLKSVERLKKFALMAIVPGIMLAILVHALFNLSAIADSFAIASRQIMFFVFNPMLIILLAAMFFLVLVFATIDEKKRKVASRKAATEQYEPSAQRAFEA